MKEFRRIGDWQQQRFALAKAPSGQKIGFVPTMGALHAGHRSLLEHARRENEIVVLSIFINPTQFNNQSDFSNYPTTLDSDLEMARSVGVDFVILPVPKDIYADEYRYRLSENAFSKTLCGAHRPGHFDGVLTVVMKLFALVKPHRAYFGKKDFQQLELIRGMAESFFLDLEVIGCATQREADGLAMSSRNLRLTPSQRIKAPMIASLLRRSFQEERPTSWVKTSLQDNGFEVDYVEDVSVGTNKELRRFVAASLGEIRLIDNMSREESHSLVAKIAMEDL